MSTVETSDVEVLRQQTIAILSNQDVQAVVKDANFALSNARQANKSDLVEILMYLLACEGLPHPVVGIATGLVVLYNNHRWDPNAGAHQRRKLAAYIAIAADDLLSFNLADEDARNPENVGAEEHRERAEDELYMSVQDLTVYIKHVTV